MYYTSKVRQLWLRIFHLLYTQLHCSVSQLRHSCLKQFEVLTTVVPAMLTLISCHTLWGERMQTSYPAGCHATVYHSQY